MACLPGDVVCTLTSEGWLPIAFIALLTTFFILSLAYMLSKGFHLPRLEAWARLEFRELIVSIILVAGVVFGLAFINAANSQFSPGADIFVSARAYLDTSSSNLIDVYRQLMIADRYVAKLASFYYNVAIYLYLATATVSQSPRGGMSVLSMMIAAGLDALATGTFILMSQKVLLGFFQANSFRWILPLGLILRTFNFSRKLGATLIAIAIGTYVVFPLALLFSAQVYDAMDPHDVNIDLPPEPADLQDQLICDPFVQNFMQLGSIVWWLIWFTPKCIGSTMGFWACMLANFEAAQSLYSAANGAFMLAAAPTLLQYASMSLDDIYYPIQNEALPIVAKEVMLVVVLAVFSTILTLSCTRAISAQLGGDNQFYGVYKLI